MIWNERQHLTICVFMHNVQVYVLKRPHVDEFLQKMGELFECVLFTASLGKVSAVTLPLIGMIPKVVIAI